MSIENLWKEGRRFFIDSRNVEPTGVFIAVKGENLDGHDYVNQAFEKGAGCCIVQKPGDYKGETILVDDAVTELLKLSSSIIKSNARLKIAVTGSTGKTTTKELLYNLMSSAGTVFRPYRNFNTEIGLPLAVLNEYKGEEIVILEMGLRKPGDVKLLSDYFQPDVSFITNIGSSHLEFLKTRENIASEKMEIISGMKNGMVVINGDEPLLEKFNLSHLNVLKFGKKEHNDGILVDYTFDETSTKVWIRLHGKDMMLTLKDFWSEGQIIDLVACLTFVTFIQVPLDPYLISAINLEKGRFTTHRKDGKLIIDDSYNASYESFCSGFESVEKFEKIKKTLIMGEMLELGELSEHYHKKVLEKALKVFDCIWFFDPRKAFSSYKGVNFVHSFDELEKILEQTQGLIYIKGSNGTGLNSFLKRILE